jgi:uncharacterized protein YbbK (DUF523 family)
MLKILVSRCLYGGRTVRYDGKRTELEHPVFQKWKEEGRLVPVCPEVDGGLPVPRTPSERTTFGVFMKTGEDVTKQYEKGARRALSKARANDIAFAVLKERSPSCGSHMIYDGTFSGVTVEGEGVTTELLRLNGYIVFSEDQIDEAAALLESIEM